MNRCLAVFIAAACAAVPVLAGVAHSQARDTPRRTDGPQRIVSLVPSATDLVVALGEKRRLAGRTDYDNDVALATVPSVGGTVDANLESILALRPDLVLTWDESVAPRLLAALRRSSLNIEIVRAETIADLRTTLTRLGVLLSVQGRADSLMRAIDGGLDSVRAITAQRPRIRTFYLVWTRPLMTAAGGTFIDSLIAIAGGENIFGDLASHWPLVSIESVIARRPDVILWPRQMTDPRASLTDDPIWKGVHAVGRGRVHFIDPDLLARPGPRVVEAARELARMIGTGAEPSP